MEEPSSSGPQKPIAQSIMDTTPPNNEFNQGRIQSENEKGTTLVTLPSTNFSIKVAVTTSVAVNDSAGTTAPLVVESIPAVRTSLVVTSTPAGKAYTAIFTQTDNIVSTQYVVTQMQHPSIVLVEDDSDDDNSVANDFSDIHAALDSLSKLIHAANLPKGVKSDRSDERELDDEPVQGNQPGD
ncbi:hypothetical protein ACET3Z_024835 [Daucus carota]